MGTFAVLYAVALAAFGGIWLWRRRIAAEKNRRLDEALEAERAKRRSDLESEYGAEIAAQILAHDVWLGASEEMLFSSIGYPDQTDEKITSSKTRYTHKFCETGKGRYALRVVVDDGAVTGWEGRPEEARDAALQRERWAAMARPRATTWWTIGRAAVMAGGAAVAVLIGRAWYPTPAPAVANVRLPSITLGPASANAVPRPPAPPRATPKRPTSAPSSPIVRENPFASASAPAAPAPLEVKTE